MRVLVIDVGGTHIKVLVSGEREPRTFKSSPKLTARQMV
jgi:polyphosphate glucokinase